MDSDIDSELSELRSDFTSYLEHISQKKILQRNTALSEHSYSSVDYQQESLCSSIKTLFIHRNVQNENIAEDIDVETVDKDVKLLTYRPSVDTKPMDHYRIAKSPRDPENWEDSINKVRWNKMEKTLFERSMLILYANRLSRLTFEGTMQEHVQKIISTQKSVAEMHQLLTNFTHWDVSLCQWLHGILLSHLPDDYLASYIDILEKLKPIIPSCVNNMISTNAIGRSKEEIKPIILNEPVDPFNYMLTAYPPMKLPKNPVIILIPDFPGYGTQPNTRTYDWMNALSYLAEVDVALTAKVPWDYEDFSREEELDIVSSLDSMVDATRSKIVSIRSDDAKRPIILAGVGVSSAIACQVAVLEKVEGLVCIGFIVNSTEVKRGYEGDCILGIECPTVFVTGQLSIFSPVLDMEEFRIKLKCKTSHILVGGTDDDLVMNYSTKMKEGVTQKLVDRCVLDEIGNFLKETLEPSPKIIRKPDAENTDFKKPIFSKKKPHNKLLARLNKGNQKMIVSINNQSLKKQIVNRNSINIPCTSLNSSMTDMVKDEELMPPPSSILTQDYAVKCDNSNSSINKSEELCIPKLGNQKFSTLADLLGEQDNYKINVSQKTPSLTSINGSSVILAQDQNNILVCSSNFQPQQNPPIMGEITADQILDMPIVFADEPSEEVQPIDITPAENSSYIIINDEIVKEEVLPEDNENKRVAKRCRTEIPERLNIKQVAYDSPSKVKLVVNKAPKGLVSSGYQTFSVPSQKTGNIQFVNRLPMPTNKMRGIMSPRVTPKTVSIHQLQDSNLKLLKNSTGQPMQLNKMKTITTTQKFKKII